MPRCSSAIPNGPAARSSLPDTGVSEYGSLAIQPQHVLLALCREQAVAALFAHFGVPVDEVRQETGARLVVREMIPTSKEIPFSEAAKHVLEFAAEDADRLLNSVSFRQAGVEARLRVPDDDFE